jgi:hypothetical protein
VVIPAEIERRARIIKTAPELSPGDRYIGHGPRVTVVHVRTQAGTTSVHVSGGATGTPAHPSDP